MKYPPGFYAWMCRLSNSELGQVIRYVRKRMPYPESEAMLALRVEAFDRVLEAL